ncbi:MAG: histone deacetylase, partial [Leptospiraceae bacterium]|nr:histone deacetylase [Leptospiraceae bacterium]
TGAGHPETSRRLVAIREMLAKQNFTGSMRNLAERTASPEEIALNHNRQYVDSVRERCAAGTRHLDTDTVISAKSFDAATLAAGAGLEASDRILDGELDRALLLVRPPGHHSLGDRAMGFCLFNNIAICARYLRKQGLERIAILDWDVHHGNGTEASFYDDPHVLFISTHQYPFYPGTGAAADTGVGAGEGFTLNVPMQAGADTATYKKAFESLIIPRLNEFAPEIILISAGFDGHQRDPLAMINLDTEFFVWATQKVREVADSHCQGRIISFLEGGYDLQALAESVCAHAETLI